MTPRTEVILYALIVFIALEFFLLSFFVFLMKHRLKQAPPPTDFKWPDRVELQYTNGAGETVANKFYIPE